MEALPAEWQQFHLDPVGLEFLRDWLRMSALRETGWKLVTYPPEHALKMPSPVTLSLNVTEQCNIACTYCYFSGGYGGNRGHNASVLSRRVTERALQRFFKESDQTAPTCLYFFGGEPLLALPQIRHALELAENVGITAVKAVASNGMLLNEAAVTLFEKHEVYLAISIDGPNHDEARVRRNGSGTLRCVEERLEWLLTSHPEFLRRRVSTSCVVDAGTDLVSLYYYFQSSAALREVVHWDFDIILAGLGDGGLFGFPDQSLELLVDWYMDFVTLPDASAPDEVFWRYFFASGFNVIHRTFWSAATRGAARKQPDTVRGPLGTIDPPGSSMITVRPNGELVAGNERQKASYVVGSVDAGTDPVRVHELARRFERMVDCMQCRLCWAAPMCTLTLSDFDIDDCSTPMLDSDLTHYHQRCVLERRLIKAFADRLSDLSSDARRNCNSFLGNELEAMP